MNLQKPISRLNSLIDSDLRQKILFILVGGINTLSAYLAFVLLLRWAGNYIVASVLSYGIGMVVSYILNRRVVFKVDSKQGAFTAFCVVNLASMAVSTGVLYGLVQYLGLFVYVAQAVAIMCSMVINYLGYRAVFTYGISMNQVFSTLSASSASSPLLKMPGRAMTAWVIVGLLAIVTAFNLYISMLGNVAHDALNYMPDYVAKFVSEGRWVNFTLFNGLRAIPPEIAASLCNLFLFVFAYKVGRVNREIWSAVAFGLLVLNIPYFTMLLKWPLTLLPGCFMLALFALIAQRISRYSVLLLAGVLMFATYPAFYFVLPLLFIHQLEQENWVSMAKFVGIWILGYALGYAIAQLSVYLYTDLFMDHGSLIKFAGWRKSTPMTDIASLWANISKSAGNFKRNALYLSELSVWFYLPIAVTFVWALKNHVKYTLVVLMVIFSIYASVIALGVEVPLRSGVTLPLGMAAILLLIKSPRMRMLLLLTLFIPFAYQMHDYNDRYNQNRAIVAHMLEQNDPHGYLKQADRFKQIDITLDESQTSHYLFELVHAGTFKNTANVREHFIKPYLYKYGWKKADIHIHNSPLDKVLGEAYVKAEGDIIYLDIH